jgi:phosphoribosylamine--glycine ligase
MNILLIGSGGREHALAFKIAQSPLLKKLYIAPGNGGMGDLGELIDLDVSHHEGVAIFCRTFAIDLVVIGPEAPLVEGLADHLRAHAIAVFGPSQKAAQLEGSKAFTKALCDRASIPTARYACFDTLAEAREYLHTHGVPIVIKADGLAAGKGVTVCPDLAMAEAALADIFDGKFGSAGSQVVMEEMMEGEEVSFFALCDGETVIPFGSAQDHKRAFEGDKGPNTGGMGAYSPAPVMDEAMEKKVMDTIILPTVNTLKQEGIPFQGVLYAGLMMTAEGPKLVEYNVRFGDPECQVLMLRLKSDLLPILEACATGTLDKVACEWHLSKAMTVVLASKGYPGSYTKHLPLPDLRPWVHTHNDLTVFHAGTTWHEGQLVTSGGRVLNVCATADSFARAKTMINEGLSRLDWKGLFYRKDIGFRVIDQSRES